jgi:hypothetical protein
MPTPPPVLPEPEIVALKDGTQVTIRPINPYDADDLQSAFQRLSMESIYLRFLSFKKELTDDEAPINHCGLHLPHGICGNRQ